jgi:squalene-associated FAD-dependent desaturase
MRVAVVGAGWAGCVAAVELMRRGWQVELLEAARQAGGRARRLEVMHQGQALALDNGQHILIGAYRDTLAMMQSLGLEPEQLLRRMPLTLCFADGRGLSLPDWRHRMPATLAVSAGILAAQGWSWIDKLRLMHWALGWQVRRFECADAMSVLDVCQGLSPVLIDELIEPLCVSALNTPAHRASGRVFLRVLQDALMSSRDGADLLLPLCDLSTLLPQAAIAQLLENSQSVKMGARVQSLQHSDGGWQLQYQSEGHSLDLSADAVILACPSSEAARLVSALPQAQHWRQQAQGLQHEAITTVYAYSPGARLRRPMLALRAAADAPAQYVFDRGQLGGPPGLLAFVVSASPSERDVLEAQVLIQARSQLKLALLQPVQTVIERRATFACTPGLRRPGPRIMPDQPRLLACGDYVDGPYPATLEGAVRSGLHAAACLT